MRRTVRMMGAGAIAMALMVGCGNTQSVGRSGIDLDNMDRTVRPQDDLYRYVNGAWLDKTEIPADKSNYGIFTRLADKAKADVRAIIEHAAKDPSGSAEARRIADLYASVMDTGRLETLGMTPLEAELAKIDAISTKRELAAWFGHAGRIGVTTPVGLYISYDSRQPSRYLVHVTQSGLGMPDMSYYTDEKRAPLQKAYREYVTTVHRIAKLPGADKAAKTIYGIEAKLAGKHWTRTQRRDREKTYNKRTAEALARSGAAFSWAGYLAESGVAKEKELIVREDTFIDAWPAIFEAVSLDDWKTYARFHLVNAYATEMFAALDRAHFEFYDKTLAGVPEPKQRWERAVDAVNGVLGEAVGKLYVKEHFKPEAKARMVELVENLREAYKSAIMELDWLGEETKQKALEKLAAFRPKIGYPDKWKDYSDLVIKADDLVGNAMRNNIWRHEYRVGQLGGPVDREEWFMTPQTVNAYYNPPMNEIVFPAAILQPPFFDLEADDAVNYGAIGAVIGHEMGHGFDDQGAKFDSEGVLRNWWTKKDLEEFQKRTAKLVDQAAGYEVIDGKKLNGQLTLGENIGDLGGLTIAHRAWVRSLDGGSSPVIDGFTGAQRLFMGWAQVWARLYRPEELERRLVLDPHAPSAYRANMPPSNMPEFMEAFDVKEGDALYRPEAERVKIW